LQLVETILKQSNASPCAIIDGASNVIYIHGRTGQFLEPAPGKISVNILDMARDGLKSALSSAIRKVAIHKQEVIIRDLQIESNEGQLLLDLSLKPVPMDSYMHGLIMVVFDEKKESTNTDKKSPTKKTLAGSGKPYDELERELHYTKENLQITIEELETSNEELKSTNEELQSTNEEMETSKEELQSLNEESVTVNSELQCRIDELSTINDDMKNLLDSTNIATLFLDIDLGVRRFTPKLSDIIPL
jgi:two-component system CheB/CheR fusion protein